MRFVKNFGVGLLVVTLSSFCLAASQNAVVSGGVYDATGKPLPGIRVVLDNAALNFEREATTIEDGSYTMAEVPPHEGYRITAYRGAVKIDVRAGLAVTVGEEKNILPPLHEQTAVSGGGGSNAAVVEQRAEAVSTETISTMVSGVISGQQLRSLPLNNRNFLALGLLTPNTHDVEGGSALAGATFSISGSRPNTNMFLLDGTDNVARSSNQAIPFQVNDAVQEFRVISSTANAEYGGASGGVVNIVTQRGSNALHGSAFGYFANDRFNADTPLSVYNGSGFDQAANYAGPVNAGRVLNYAPTTYNNYVATAQALGFCTDSIGGAAATGKTACVTGGFGKNTRFDPAAILGADDSRTQPFDSRQYGANAGGAVIKDKLFVFGSYEGTWIDNPNPIFERVPSTFDKTYNPLLAAGVPLAAAASPFYMASNNVDRLFAQKLLALYPSANVVAVPNALEFFRGEAPNYTHVHNGIAHADYVQSKNASWSLRYAAQSLNQLHDDTLPKGGTYPGNGAIRDAFNQNAILTHSHSFGRFVTETRVGITRFRVNETPQDASLDATTLGMPTKQMMTVLLSGLDPQYSGATPFGLGAFANWIDSYWLGNPPAGFPAVDGQASFPTLNGLFPMARLGAPLSAPGQRRDTTWLAGENVSWSKARHIVKFGGGFRSFQNNLSNGGFSRGLLNSGNIGEFTSDSMSCIFCFVSPTEPLAFAFPSFDTALRQPTPYIGRFSSFAVEGYVQDTWKIHPRVTVNAGLRYDYFSPPTEANSLMYNFDPISNGLVKTGTSTVLDPFGQKCQNPEPFAAVYQSAGAELSWKCTNSGNGGIALPSANDFGPRVGVAWDIRGNGNTVVRGGFGLFYDQSPAGYTSQLIFNRPSALDLKNPQALYGTNFFFGFCLQCGLGNTTVNPATTNSGNALLIKQFLQAASSPLPVYARNLNQSDTPYTRQLSATVQQKVTGNLTAEVGYIGTSGFRLPSVTNTGFNNEWFCNISCDALNPVFTLSNASESSYHSLMTRLHVAEFHGLGLNATYNWSKSMDNASGASFPLIPVTLSNQIFGFQYYGQGVPFRVGSGAQNQKGIGTLTGLTALSSDTLASGVTTTGLGQVITSRYTLPQDPNNYLRDDYGRSDFDSKHRFVLDYSWSIPAPHASRWSANVLGNWSVSGIVVTQSGQPFTVFAGPVGGEVTQRADLTGAVTINGGNPNQYINGSAFTPAGSDPSCARNFSIVEGTLFGGKVGTPCLGNTRRNEFTGPAFAKMDMAVQKGIQIREGKMLMLRAEFYNLFNRANFYNPISVLAVDGVTRNADFGKVKSAHEPFSVQLAARFSW